MGMLSVEAATAIANIANPQMLLQIMERFDMLIPCQINHADIYMVPCLRKKARDDQVVKGDIPSIPFRCVSASEVKSGSLRTKGFIPPGLFHRLISSCCRVKKWAHFRNLIFYDYMLFNHASGFSCALRLVSDDIVLSAFNFVGDSSSYSSALSALREDVQKLLAEILDQVFPNLSWVTFLPCPCLETPASTTEKSR